MPGRCSTGFLSAINIKDDEADNASNPAAPTPRGTNHGSLSHLDHELQPAQLVSPSRVRAWVQPSPLLLKPTTTSGGGGGEGAHQLPHMPSSYRPQTLHYSAKSCQKVAQPAQRRKDAPSLALCAGVSFAITHNNRTNRSITGAPQYLS